MPQSHGTGVKVANKGELRWVDNYGVTAAGSLAVASRAVGTGQSAAFAVPRASVFKARLNVTNPNGGTLRLSLQGSMDGTTGWTTIASYPTASRRQLVGKAFSFRRWSHLRWQWVVSGAAVTFGVAAARDVQGVKR